MKRKPLLDPNRHFNGKPLGRWDPSKEKKQYSEPRTKETKLRAEGPKPEPEPIQGNAWARGTKLEVFILSTPGATMEQAFEKAEKEKRVIASNKRLDRALVGSDEWRSIRKGLWCWSGTMTAYERAGEPFAEVVEYIDDNTGLKYLFEVPRKYRGKKDCILVCEHPDVSLETKGNQRIIRAARIDLIENFPAKDGWYLTDPKHGFPFGDSVGSSDPNARHLWRIEKRVGFSRRDHDVIGNYRVIFLGSLSSSALGVVVEAPERGAQKNQSSGGASK